MTGKNSFIGNIVVSQNTEVFPKIESYYAVKKTQYLVIKFSHKAENCKTYDEISLIVLSLNKLVKIEIKKLI